MPWITPTEANLLTAISGAELALFRSTALAGVTNGLVLDGDTFKLLNGAGTESTNVSVSGSISGASVTGTNSIQAGNILIKFYSYTQAGGTNQHIDPFNGIYQTWTATNGICILYVTNWSAAASVKFRPNGANRNILMPTNWVWLNQGLLSTVATTNGNYYQVVLTNGTSEGWLSTVFDGGSPINVTASWSWGN